MTQKTYDRQSGKLIARIAENFPEVSTEIMQNCIQNPERFSQALKKAVESDGILRFGVWRSLPKDQMREHGLICVSDRLVLKETIDSKGIAYWEDYASPNISFRGICTKISESAFEARKLVKVPIDEVVLSNSRREINPFWMQDMLLEDCTVECAPRVHIRKQMHSWEPYEKLCFAGDLARCNQDLPAYWVIKTEHDANPRLHFEPSNNFDWYTHMIFAAGVVKT